MTRRVFNTTCDIFAGPGSTTPGSFRGTFPCRLVPQNAIDPVGIGAIHVPYWLTLDAYAPVGSWPQWGFGANNLFADQVAVPSGTVPRFWVWYTDKVKWFALTPYFRSYLAYLPLPKNCPCPPCGEIKWAGRQYGSDILFAGPFNGAFPATVEWWFTAKRQGVKWRTSGTQRANFLFGKGPVILGGDVKLLGGAQGARLRLETQCSKIPGPIWTSFPLLRGAVKWKLDVKLHNPAYVPATFYTIAAATPGSSISAHWPAATTTGNTVLICMTGSTTSGTPMTFSPPAGYSSVYRTTNTTGLGHSIAIEFFAIFNAASRFVNETVGLTGTNKQAATIYLVEISGVTGVYDQHASNNGTNYSLTSGTTGTTSQSSEYSLSLYQALCGSVPVWASPLNGFSILGSQTTLDRSIILGNVLQGINTYSTGVSYGAASMMDVWGSGTITLY